MKTFLAYTTYYLGHWISRPMVWWGWSFLYRPYSVLMKWSSKLDVKERIWYEEKI